MVSPVTSMARGLAVAAAFAILVSSGCNKTPSANEAVDAALKVRGQTRSTVFPLSGNVTVDGQAVEPKGNPLLVVLNDMSKPDTPPSSRPYVGADKDGNFAFSTYTPGDGLPPGKYVLTFVRLKFNKKKGLVGPDQLKNLYNDPDQNAKDSRFVIDLQPPVKTELAFNLEVAGKDAGTPGPHALTELKGK
jgi:hypothetical protein